MRILLAIASATLFVAAPAAAQTAQPTWQLVWSDEFNGPAGSAPNPQYWSYDLGTDCCGNNELETYTNAAENAHMDGQGHLDIHIENPSPGVYTSGRIKTEMAGSTGFTIQYGRIEARLKMPFGQGIWPAFWMLGNNIQTVGWPQCGEIDIMESIGRTPNLNYGSVHAPGYNATAQYALANNQDYSSDFHTFAIEWSATAITFYVDGTSYETITPTDAGAAWVFNTPFFVVLNVAVGGDWPGPPDATTQFPQDMLVDYVRVYQATSAAGPVINAGGIVDAASGSPALTPGSLASIYGPSLAASENKSLFDSAAGAFSTSASGVSVFVNGAAAPLTYLSPLQINFAIPWDSLLGTPLNVEVMLNNVLSNAVPITLAPAAPSVFAKDGVALLTCPGGAPQPGAVCTLWGNGFGPTNPPLVDGTPAPSKPLPWTSNTCTLSFGSINAKVDYCGAAPGLIIYQMNFVYPAGVVANGSTVTASITIDGNTGNIVLPAP